MNEKPDYGADPLGGGKFRMVPSGDIVDAKERDKRLQKKTRVQNGIFGMSWDELERRQGGRLNRNV